MNDVARGASPIPSAILGSFIIYLFPVLLPHTTVPFGVAAVLSEISSGQRSLEWIVTVLACTAALQAIAAFLFYWFIRRPGFVLPILAFPILFVAVQVLYYSTMSIH